MPPMRFAWHFYQLISKTDPVPCLLVQVAAQLLLVEPQLLCERFPLSCNGVGQVRRYVHSTYDATRNTPNCRAWVLYAATAAYRDACLQHAREVDVCFQANAATFISCRLVYFLMQTSLTMNTSTHKQPYGRFLFDHLETPSCRRGITHRNTNLRLGTSTEIAHVLHDTRRE